MKKLRISFIIVFSVAIFAGICALLVSFSQKSDPDTVTVAIVDDSKNGNSEIQLLEYVNDVKKAFLSSHPNARLNISVVPLADYSAWLSNSALSGEMPDIFSVLPADFPTYSEVGQLSPLPEEFISQSSKGVTGHWMAGGKLYAMPYFYDPPCIIINKSLLPGTYFEVDESTFDWIDIIYAAQFLNRDTNADGVTDIFGITNISWKDLAYANGCQIVDYANKKTHLTSDEAEYATKFFLGISKASIDSRIDAFENGSSIMKATTLCDAAGIVSAHNENSYIVLPFPKGPDGDFATEPTDIPLAVNAKSSSKQLSIEFLRALCLDRDNQELLSQKTNGYPVAYAAKAYADAKALRYMSSSASNTMLNYGSVDIDFFQYYEFMDTIESSVFQLLKNDVYVEAELARIESDSDALLQNGLPER